MNAQFRADDLAAIRAEGSLVELFAHLTGKQVPQAEETEEPDVVEYHIPRPGAWPCGTAPSGPTPPPCTDCKPEEDDEAR